MLRELCNGFSKNMEGDEMYPRLLVISHNVLDYRNNVGKTLLSLLESWPKEKLFSLYFRNELPQDFKCSSYYQINDKNVLRALVSLKAKKSGVRFSEADAFGLRACSASEEKLYILGNKRKPFISFCRDMMWHLGSWKDNSLRAWLREIAPEVVLFVPNDYELAFDVVRYVMKIVSSKMVLFYMDDTFYYGQNNVGIDWLRRKRLLKAGTKCADQSEMIFTVCDSMSQEYNALFAKQCVVFGNCVDYPQNDQANFIDSGASHTDVKISYIGNLHSNRWKSLIEIGAALNKYNALHRTVYSLDIYTASLLGGATLEILNNAAAVNLCGKLEPDEVRKIQMCSDILVHVESFDPDAKKSTRLSVSTKIYEYLFAGKPILAYGPAGIASMKLLEETNAACCCYAISDIENHIDKLLFDRSYRRGLGENGRHYAQDHFDADKCRNRFQGIIRSLIERK